MRLTERVAALEASRIPRDDITKRLEALERMTLAPPCGRRGHCETASLSETCAQCGAPPGEPCSGSTSVDCVKSPNDARSWGNPFAGQLGGRGTPSPEENATAVPAENAIAEKAPETPADSPIDDMAVPAENAIAEKAPETPADSPIDDIEAWRAALRIER